jgi:hypothetical protein
MPGFPCMKHVRASCLLCLRESVQSDSASAASRRRHLGVARRGALCTATAPPPLIRAIGHAGGYACAGHGLSTDSPGIRRT